MTHVGVESCCWWGDIKLLNQLTHLLKLQPLNNLSEAIQCTEKCKTQFFQAYRKETQAMFSKFTGTELEEVPSSPTGPCVREQQCEHPQKHQFASEPTAPNFPCLPCPGAGYPVLSGWRGQTWRKMNSSSKASRRLAENGIVWEGNFTTLWQIQAFKQLAAPQTHQPQPVPTARRCLSCQNKGLMQTRTPCRHLSKTTPGGTGVATDGCQGMRQHQASTQEHFPQVLS